MNSEERLMSTCKKQLAEEILSDFWYSHIRYLIFDIQLDIRLIFGGGKLTASILVGSMGGIKDPAANYNLGWSLL